MSAPPKSPLSKSNLICHFKFRVIESPWALLTSILQNISGSGDCRQSRSVEVFQSISKAFPNSAHVSRLSQTLRIWETFSSVCETRGCGKRFFVCNVFPVITGGKGFVYPASARVWPRARFTKPLPPILRGKRYSNIE